MDKNKSSRSAADIAILNRIDYAKDQLRELMKRWDNRLTQEMPILESYERGLLMFQLEFDVPGGVDSHAKRRYVHSSAAPLSSDEDIPIKRFVALCFKADGKSMFVNDVNFVESTKGQIPSALLIGLYRVNDETDNVSSNQLYLSAFNKTYQFRPGICEWEMQVAMGSNSSKGYHFTGQMIQDRAKIVNDVAYPEWYFFRDWMEFKLKSGGLKLLINRGNVCLMDNSRILAIEKFIDDRVKLVDVLIGPFDL